MLDYDGFLPNYIQIPNGKVSDNNAAEEMPIPENSVVVANRFYQDFSLLNKWDSKYN